MNQWNGWFSSGLKIKRWLLLVIVGTIVLSYGFSNLKLATQLNVHSVIITMLLFIIGLVAIVTGFIMTHRRMLQAIAESNEASKARKFNVKNLLYDKNSLERNIKIVAIGQGDGMEALLQGLKNYSTNITSIVSTVDGSNGQTIEMDEIKRAIVSLAQNDKEELNDFLNYRSTTGEEMSSMIFEAMMSIHEDNFSRAVGAVSDVIAISGKVVPSTVDKATLGVELADGTRIHGKQDIISNAKVKKLSIEKVFLTPERCAPAPGVIKSIKEADLIIMGPGSLYTGILPILLIKEIADEIKKSKAIKIFVSSIMTEAGQTDGFALSDYINAIHAHAGKGIMNYCVASDSDIMPEYIRMYNKRNSDVIDIDKPKIKNTGVKLVVEDMSVVDDKGKIRHDSIKLAKAVITLLLQSIDISQNDQAVSYYTLKNKMKGIDSKHKQKSVLFRNVKIISSRKK